MKNFFTICSLFSVALASAHHRHSHSARREPKGCVSVAKSGGDFSTIQGAVDSLSVNATTAQCITISAGKYEEQVLVPKRKAQLSVYGATTDDYTYAANTVTISYGLSQAFNLSNDETATLRIKASGFRLYNVNVENTYGDGSQAVALSAYSDSGFYGCSFVGYQDTLLSQQGNQVYVKNEIVGVTDFIFGQRSRAWFEEIDIRLSTPLNNVGYVTANGNKLGGNSTYVFNNCDIAAGANQSVPDGAFYLGRPWGNESSTIFQKTSMSAAINSAGWAIWSKTDNRTSGVTYAEFDNTGAGANGTRANFAEKLTKAIKIEEVLGSSYKQNPYFDKDYYHRVTRN